MLRMNQAGWMWVLIAAGCGGAVAGLGQQVVQPEVGEFFLHGVLAQAGVQVGEVHLLQVLVLVVAGVDVA